VIKAFLNLCLTLFLNTLACLVAFIAAAAVAWAALWGAKWLLAALHNAVIALRARQRKKETHAYAAR
jgi:hypothetical protein